MTFLSTQFQKNYFNKTYILMFNLNSRECNDSPIIYEPDHLTEAVLIDDNALFMVMFTESVMNVLVDTGNFDF